jgi:hypothetical protein
MGGGPYLPGFTPVDEDGRAEPVRRTGEHGNAACDAVKKEALRRAGIGYVEVAGDTPAELRRVVSGWCARIECI